MMDPFANMYDALDPLLEDLLWKPRKLSTRGTHIVRGSVMHWRKQIEVYQTVVAGVVKRYSDTWTVMIPVKYTIVAEFKVGDTLVRQNGEKEELYIQSVTKDDHDWTLAVTSTQKLTA